MKKTLSVLVCLVAAMCLTTAQELNWIYEPDAAFKTAQESGKPIFTDVFTTWCSWCKKLDKETFTHPDFLAIAPKFVLLKLDADKYPDFKKKYAVPGYPTMLFLNAEGKEIHEKVIGFVTAAELVPIMKEALASQAVNTSASAGELTWLYVPDQAFQAAHAQNKRVFVDVFTTWCHWCKKLDEETYQDPQFKAEAARFILLKVDGDKYRDFVLKYNVKGYPTMLFLNCEGKEVHERVVGYVPATELVPVMKKVQ